jgi:hypothetical protein
MKKVITIVVLFSLVFSLFGCKNKEANQLENQPIKNNSTNDCNAISGQIPNGGVYICSDKTVLTAGEDFPEPQKGDIFQYNNFRYGFEKKFNEEINAWEDNKGVVDAWYVHILDETQNAEYDVLTEISGKKVITNHLK